MSFFSIKQYIKVAKRKSLHQPIRSDGPESHLKTKKQTPTMGGIFIVLGTLVSTLFFLDLTNHYVLIAIFVLLSFAAIGLVDDLMKVLYKNTKGFPGSIKIVIQFFIIGITFIALEYTNSIHSETKVLLPVGQHYWISLGLILYILFITFVIVGTSNAVNLTDGLDGLVSVPAIISLICLSFMIIVASNPEMAGKFKVAYVRNSAELVLLCISMIGAIAAFLKFNLKPAKIFMGDVGSLAIGSFIGLVAIIIKQEFIFFVISLLFVAEAVSVILQVGSYKLRKKRIFLMAPLHHHFEKLGWSEKKVVRAFWSLSLTSSVIGMLLFVM